MKIMPYAIAVAIISMQSINSWAAYSVGYSWKYNDMFSTTSNVGTADSEGSYVWQYKWAQWENTIPTGQTGLSTVNYNGGWTRWGSNSYNRISQNLLQSRYWEGNTAWLEFVAPVSGNFSLDATGVFQGDQAASPKTTNWQWAQGQVDVWKITTTNEITLLASIRLYGSGYSNIHELALDQYVTLEQGDRIALRLSRYGGDTDIVRLNDFNMSVTLVPEPSAIASLGLFGLTLLGRRK